MSFLEQIREAKNSPSTAWNIFLTEYRPNGDVIFAFHEGRDDTSFYRHHIEAQITNRWKLKFVHCGNKKAVLKHSTEFSKRYPSNPRVLFFLDKDHDDLINENEERPYVWTYTTSCYSIENFLCNPHIVRACLTDIFGIEDMDHRCNLVAQQYEEAKDILHEIGAPIMAWIICARKHGMTVNLNNIKSPKIFNITDNLHPELIGNLEQIYDYLSKTTGDQNHNTNPPQHDINLEIQNLKSTPSTSWFRGKEDVWFLVSFIDKITKHLNVKPRISIGPQNALAVLGPRSRPPGCLAEFLNRAITSLSTEE